MQSFGRIAGLLLGFCLATATLAAPQKPTDEEVENAIQIVTTNSTTLGPGEGFRCGVFFAGEKTEDPPIETIMVLPRRFAMDCTQPPAKQQELGQEECFDLFRIITSKINVRSKSRRNPGNTIGDDLCDRLKISGMKRVPGPGHPKPEFRDGMKVGFFYNTCTDTKWYNTGLEIPEQVCCQKKTWKNIPCP